MNNKLWIVSSLCMTTVIAALYPVHLLANDSRDGKRGHHWQQGFPLSIIEGERVGRPDLNRPLSYRNTEATDDQVDPLMKTADVRFSDEVKTVGDAARVVLAPVGYEMVTTGNSVSPMLARFLQSPLPDNQRVFAHLRVHEMLRALAGVGYVVVFDHIERRATFDPLPRYEKLGKRYGVNSNTLFNVTEQPIQALSAQTIAKVPSAQTAAPEALIKREQLDSVLVGADNEQWQDISSGDARDQPDSILEGADNEQWQVISSGDARDQPDSVLEGADTEQWQVISSGDARDQFAEEVAAVISKNKPASGSYSDGSIEIIQNRADNVFLDISSEIALRRIAERFDPIRNRVVIRNCSGDVLDDSQTLHRELIKAAMSRLGVAERYQVEHDCGDMQQHGHPEGKTQYLIALTEATAGTE